MKKKPHLLAEQIKSQISKRIWLSGDKLPSIRSTCKRYGLSIETVLQAYQILENQGYVKSKPRSGYYVLPQYAQSDSGEVEPVSDKVSDTLYDVLQRSKDPEIVPLNSAFPDPALYPYQALSRSLANASRQMPSNAMLINLPPGAESLRRHIAKRYQKHGMDVVPEQIVITSGAMEALSLSLQAVTSPGDTVAIEYPAFYGVLQALERLNLKAREIPAHPVEGLDVDELENALSSEKIDACWFMSEAQNPLGYSLSKTQKRRIAKLVNQYQVPLIEDDVYRELNGEDASLPIKGYDRGDQVLLCSSFSKTLSPGFRIGWVVAGKHTLEIQRLLHLSNLSSSIPIQLALSHYLTYYNYDNHLKKLRETLKSRKQCYMDYLDSVLPEAVKTFHLNSGYFLWIELPEQVDAQSLYDQLIQQQVAIAPGVVFSTDKNFRHHIRLNASYELDEKMETALDLLASVVNKMIKSPLNVFGF